MEEQKEATRLSKFHNKKYNKQNTIVDTWLNREPIKFQRNHSKIFELEIIYKQTKNWKNSKKTGR